MKILKKIEHSHLSSRKTFYLEGILSIFLTMSLIRGTAIKSVKAFWDSEKKNS